MARYFQTKSLASGVQYKNMKRKRAALGQNRVMYVDIGPAFELAGHSFRIYQGNWNGKTYRNHKKSIFNINQSGFIYKRYREDAPIK